MSRIPIAELLQLPTNEKLELIQQLCEIVEPSGDPCPISEAEKQLIDQRLDAYRSNPTAVAPWPEVKARILGRE